MAKDLRAISSFPRSEIEPGETGIIESGTVLLADIYGFDDETVARFERAGWVREATPDEITAELARTGEIDGQDVERDAEAPADTTTDTASTSPEPEPAGAGVTEEVGR